MNSMPHVTGKGLLSVDWKDGLKLLAVRIDVINYDTASALVSIINHIVENSGAGYVSYEIDEV